MNFTTVKLEATEGAVLTVLDARQTLKRHSTKKWRTREARRIESFVWHHAAGEISVEQIAKYHVGNKNHISKTGCPAICYHFFIGNDGSIYLCNDFESITWSNGVRSANNKSISACFEGNLTKRAPTPAQIAAALELFNWSLVYFRHVFKNTLQLYGHREVKAGTVCPGDFLSELIKALRSYIKKGETKTEMKGNLMTLIESYQIALQAMGFYDSLIDNDFGPKSKAATREFQESRDIKSTGERNKVTTEFLFRAMASMSLVDEDS